MVGDKLEMQGRTIAQFHVVLGPHHHIVPKASCPLQRLQRQQYVMCV